MPKIDLCFSGWLRGVEVSVARDANFELINVSKLASQELVEKLHKGEIFVSLVHLLTDGEAEEDNIEMFDFEVPK